MKLSYRDISHQPALPAQTPVVELLAPVKPLCIEERVRRLIMNHHRQVRQREQSMLVRMDAEVGLPIEAALHYRNHIQGDIPFHEWMDYERSHVAMS